MVKDYLGQEFKNQQEMCKAHGIPYKTYGMRKHKGYKDPYYGYLYPVKDSYKGIKIVYQGVEYNSLESLADTLNISYGLLKTALEKKGLSPDEAVKYAKMPRSQRKEVYDLYSSCRGKSVEYKGTAYPSISAFCRTYNVGQSTLVKKMARYNLSSVIEAYEFGIYRNKGYSTKEAIAIVKNRKA